MRYTGRVDLSKATKEELLAIIEKIPRRWLIRSFREDLEKELHALREDRLLTRMHELVALMPNAANREEWLRLQDEFTVVDRKLSKLQGV
jgi:hypothetical protein